MRIFVFSSNIARGRKHKGHRCGQRESRAEVWHLTVGRIRHEVDRGIIHGQDSKLPSRILYLHNSFPSSTYVIVEVQLHVYPLLANRILKLIIAS